MLTIRLQRMGKKKQPTYRLVISEKARDTQAKSLEILGHYNPVAKEKVLELKADRIKYWLSQGAQASNTVNNLLVKEGVIEGKKAKSVRITDKRQAKMNEKVKEEKAKTEEEKKASEPAPTEDKSTEEISVKEDTKEEKPAEEVKEEKKEKKKEE